MDTKKAANPVTETVLVVGNGVAAREMATQLLEGGGNVALVCDSNCPWAAPLEGNERLELIENGSVRSCRRQGSVYDLQIEVAGKLIHRTVEDVVLALDSVRSENHALYGLSPSERVVGISKAPDRIARLPERGDPYTVVFLTGLVRESDPIVAEEVMRCVLRSRNREDIRAVVLTDNLKVAGEGLESLYRECRRAGAWFVQSKEAPSFRQNGKESLIASYFDESVREPFALQADLVVVDETIHPSPELDRLAKILQIETDSAGFAQADNVHRLTVATNRSGIWTIGGSRAADSSNRSAFEAGCAARAVRARAMNGSAGREAQVRVDPAKCVRCLTCCRSCPYHAVTIGRPISVDPALCQRCGICIAECPALAISAPGLNYREALVRKKDNGKTQKDVFPEIVAFCCSRSAAAAAEMASCMGRRQPEGIRIVEVPCAGGISVEHLVAAFFAGADGVMALHCHSGNCHSGIGNQRARERAEWTKQLLSDIGLEPDRLLTDSLASNMGAVFAEIVSDFEETLKRIGPTRLKPEH